MKTKVGIVSKGLICNVEQVKGNALLCNTFQKQTPVTIIELC